MVTVACSYSQSTEFMRHKGDSLYAAQNFPGAVAAFTEMIKLKPGSSAGYAGRGKAYFATEQDSAALSDYEKAIELNPSDPELYYLKGRLERITGDYSAALRDLSIAIEMDSAFIPPYVERGHTFAAMNKWNGAWVYYNLAIIKDPEQPVDVYFRRGFGYQMSGAFVQAMDDYGHVLRQQPDHLDALLNSGNCLLSLREYDKAIDRYDRLIALSPDDGRCYYGRGYAKILKGDKQEGCSDLERAAAYHIEEAKSLILTNCQ